MFPQMTKFGVQSVESQNYGPLLVDLFLTKLQMAKLTLSDGKIRIHSAERYSDTYLCYLSLVILRSKDDCSIIYNWSGYLQSFLIWFQKCWSFESKFFLELECRRKFLGVKGPFQFHDIDADNFNLKTGIPLWELTCKIKVAEIWWRLFREAHFPRIHSHLTFSSNHAHRRMSEQYSEK